MAKFVFPSEEITETGAILIQAMRNSETKTCRKCNTCKLGSEFFRHPKTKDGLHSYCKHCFKELATQWKKSHLDKVKDYARRYYLERRDAILNKSKRRYAAKKA